QGRTAVAGSRKRGAEGRYRHALRCGAATAVVVAIVLAVGERPVRAATGESTTRARVTVAPSGVVGSVGYLRQIWQTYNNCGPASVAEVLAHWGITRTQYQVQLVLRADHSPSGMAPYGVPTYARSLGL